MIDFKGCVGSEQVAVYLEDAGKCLMSMPMSGHTTRARISKLPFVVPGGLEAFSVGDGRLRLPQPRPETIDRMDEVLAWISLIPQDKVILAPHRGGACVAQSGDWAEHLFVAASR